MLHSSGDGAKDPEKGLGANAVASICAEGVRKNTDPHPLFPPNDGSVKQPVGMLSRDQVAGKHVPSGAKHDNRQTIERLQKLLDDHRHRGHKAAPTGLKIIPTGLSALDEALPDGGLPTAALIEILTAGSGIGARTLALRAAVAAAAGGLDGDVPSSASQSANLVTLSKCIVVVDCDGDFYPPAAAAMGIPMDSLLIIRPKRAADAFWAAEQALRCKAVGAVVATRLPLDGLRSRRLQLIAEDSGGMILTLASAKTKTITKTRSHSFAAVQLLIEPLPRAPATVASPLMGGVPDRCCRITVLKSRERIPVETLIVGPSDETFHVPPHPIPADRAAVGKLQRVPA